MVPGGPPEPCGPEVPGGPTVPGGPPLPDGPTVPGGPPEPCGPDVPGGPTVPAGPTVPKIVYTISNFKIQKLIKEQIKCTHIITYIIIRIHIVNNTFHKTPSFP